MPILRCIPKRIGENSGALALQQRTRLLKKQCNHVGVSQVGRDLQRNEALDKAHHLDTMALKPLD